MFDPDAASTSDEESKVSIVTVDAGDGLAFVKTLFVEYAEAFGHAHCFAGFDRELDRMPSPYQPPDGVLFLASVDDRPAGCIAVRRLDDTDAEMKRLYVRPQFRGHSLGRRLTEAAIDFARQAGYATLRLETLPGAMAVAISVYKTLGFEPCPPYGDNPVDMADHLALRL
ncbi:MAG: GNAT family N-acetyltransferase [Alphaproteobacteria bacterium]